MATATDVSARRASAFVRLTESHLDRSYRLAQAILLNAADAEDATHDAIVRAWDAWHSLREESRFEPWFQRILVNTCRDRLRRTRRYIAQDLSLELVGASDANALLQADDRSDIGRALATLSPDHRVVVAMRYYLDLQVNDIAARLGVPVGTVNSRLHNALKRIRAGIERPGSASHA